MTRNEGHDGQASRRLFQINGCRNDCSQCWSIIAGELTVDATGDAFAGPATVEVSNPVTLRDAPNECTRRARRSRPTTLFFHSGDAVCVLVLSVSVQGGTNTQEELERVTEIVAVIAVERVGAVVDGELGAKSDVEAVAM